ncbi:MAG: TIR domain-containing protein [Mobilitalea sp.]
MAKRVFFSFHYQDVIDFRANVVRNHKTTKHEGAGYFDASIWEASKKEGGLALKRLINSEIQNTTVTAVLIGADTYSRPWVRYEIFKSVFKGNKIIGIHINSIKGRDSLTKSLGQNPFEYLAIEYSNDGTKLYLKEYKNGEWVSYDNLDGWSVSNTNQSNWGKAFKLSTYYKVYDWVSDNGYTNFGNWID